ncbi:hypothetical protein SISNIDRAFT_506642, partial [Sistotremastrum niveocremeum HHB9708]
LEQAVLSGELFAGRNRSPSPARSLSPDHPANSNYPSSSGGGLKEWPTEEWEGSYHYPSRQYGSARGSSTGQTGVKGVLRDSSLASSSAQLSQLEAERERKRVWLRGDLGGLTYSEEQALDRRRYGDDSENERGGQGGGDGDGEGGGKAFGHLREVVESNFVRAVEGEGRDTWVVMHIYHPTLERCATLDQSLVLLARSYPSVKFLHARADKLGFASLSSSSHSSSFSSSAAAEYDLNSDDDFDFEEDEYAPVPPQKTDLDVLPTLLVYKGGQLIHTWVRVDWIVEAEVGSGTSGTGNGKSASGGGSGNGGGGGRGGGMMMFRREEGEDGGIKELLEK